MEFAKKTGDYVSLSQADFQVIALAVQRIKASGKESFIKEKPAEATEDVNQGGQSEDDKNQDNEEGEEEEDEEEEPNQPNQAQNTNAQAQAFFFDSEYDEDELKDLEEFARVQEALAKGLKPEEFNSKTSEDKKTEDKEQSKSIEVNTENKTEVKEVKEEKKAEKMTLASTQSDSKQVGESLAEASESKPAPIVSSSTQPQEKKEEKTEDKVKLVETKATEPKQVPEKDNSNKDNARKDSESQGSSKGGLFSGSEPSTKGKSDKAHPQLWYEDKDFDADDDEGWINPSNINNVLYNASVTEGSLLDQIGVGIMTSDFAVQNIVLQMGIPLLATDGMIIKRVKSYVLECFTCYGICRDNSKQFCPSCGHNTLLRVTCSFNLDGSFVLYRKKGYKVSLRGRKFAIPTPVGGNKNNDLILSEDQLDMGAMKRKIQRREKYFREQLTKTDEMYQNGMTFDDIRVKNQHFKTYEAGYGRSNPNDNEFWRKKGASRKKR